MPARNGSLSDLPQTAADGCERLRMAAKATATSREQGSIPPELSENPSLRIREKTKDRKNKENVQYKLSRQETPNSVCDVKKQKV